MDERNFFVVEKNRLIPLRQYEAKLHRLSPIQRLLNKINYDANMRYTKSKIWRALKKGLPVCYLEYLSTTEEEVKDIAARLKYLGYNIDLHISYVLPRPLEIRVRLDDSEEGIDYVSY